MGKSFSHFDKAGNASMVDVGAKPDTVREAVAQGRITTSVETFGKINEGSVGKGDVLGVARLAGIMAAKKVDELIPLAHPLAINQVEIAFQLDNRASAVEITAKVKCTGKTGVEMEALTAVSVTALTIYDMCKAVDKDMVIDKIRLISKSGGKSGPYLAGEV